MIEQQVFHLQNRKPWIIILYLTREFFEMVAGNDESRGVIEKWRHSILGFPSSFPLARSLGDRGRLSLLVAASYTKGAASVLRKHLLTRILFVENNRMEYVDLARAHFGV